MKRIFKTAFQSITANKRSVGLRVICATTAITATPFWFSTTSSGKPKCQSTESEKMNELWCDEEVVNDWYNKGNEYWNSCEETKDGVMGGYGYLSERDIRFSRYFLEQLQKSYKFNFERVLDCGAGIGRVSKELLVRLFQKVDLLEQSERLINAAQRELSDNPRVQDFYCVGMQGFKFEHKYDVVWVQWVSNQIKDEDYVEFLKRCTENLQGSGVLIVKENIAERGYILDQVDSSVTRSDLHYKDLFQQAKLKVVLEMTQPEFPEELFDVKMYALKPQGEIKEKVNDQLKTE